MLFFIRCKNLLSIVILFILGTITYHFVGFLPIVDNPSNMLFYFPLGAAKKKTPHTMLLSA